MFLQGSTRYSLDALGDANRRRRLVAETESINSREPVAPTPRAAGFLGSSRR